MISLLLDNFFLAVSGAEILEFLLQSIFFLGSFDPDLKVLRAHVCSESLC